MYQSNGIKDDQLDIYAFVSLSFAQIFFPTPSFNLMTAYWWSLEMKLLMVIKKVDTLIYFNHKLKGEKYEQKFPSCEEYYLNKDICIFYNMNANNTKGMVEEVSKNSQWLNKAKDNKLTKKEKIDMICCGSNREP